MVFGAVFNPSLSSPMWWMGAFYAVYLVFLLVEVWSMFTHHDEVHRYACLASSCTAVLAPTTLGAVFGVVLSRSYWYGLFTPMTMLVTALLAGSAVLGIVFVAVVHFELAGFERARRLALPAIRILLAVALVGSIALLARSLASGLTSDDRGLLAATTALVSGPLAVGFWARVICWIAHPARPHRPAGDPDPGRDRDRGGPRPHRRVRRPAVVRGRRPADPDDRRRRRRVDRLRRLHTEPRRDLIVVAAFAFIAFVYTLAERYLDLRESEVHLGSHLPRFVGTTREWLASRSATRLAVDVIDEPAGSEP